MLEWNADLSLLIVNFEKKLEMIVKWLRGSGLIVNESKTEVCLFHRYGHPTVVINIQNAKITSKKEMHVLGVIFNSKLSWAAHVAFAINKSKKAIFAIKALKRYFNVEEMRVMLDLNYYSILYYNSALWLTLDLNVQLKQDQG